MRTNVGLEPRGRRISLPLRLASIVGLSVFLIEIALMLLQIPSRLGVWEALLDGVLLTLLVSPILYVSLLRPLAAEIAKRDRAQRGLIEAQRDLERQVEERTTGLSESLARLQSEVAERGRMEQELMRFKLGIERSGEAVFMTAVDGEIIYANPAFEELFDLRREDWQGKTPRILKSGLLSQGVYEHFWSTLLGRQVVAGELVNKTKDGRLLTVQSSANPILGRDGELLGFLAIQRDVTAQKQAEAVLRESELQLQAAQRLAAIGSWSWDIATDTVTWSAELYAINGLNPDLPPPSFAEQPAYYTPESWSALSQAVERAVRTGEPYELEVELIRRDGEHRWTIAMGVPLRDDGGKIRGLHGTVQDIEEKKQAALQLKESEETWRTLVNSNPESLFLVDTEGTVLVANETAAARVGRSLEDLVGASLRDLLPEEAAATRRQVMEEVVRTGRPVRFQDRLHGRYIDYHAHPVLDGQGRVARLAVLGVDLTEHREADEALARAGAATQALLGMVSRLNAELSPADMLQAVCEETLRAFRVDGVSISLYSETANALIGAASIGLPPHYDEQGQPLPRTLYDEYVKRMGPLIAVPDVRTFGGLPDQGLYASLDIRSVVVASMVREGELIGILTLICLHEVREFTPDELSLLDGLAAQAAQAVHGTRLREQLRQSQKLEAIGSLAGGIAHDFNNLLTPIIGLSEFLLEGWGTEEAQRSDVEEIRNAAERAAALTRQLLAFSRQQPLRPRVLDLNEALTSMGALLPRVLGEDISLEVRAATDLGRVEADPGQVEQVILNLAVNARDAMPDGGSLTIETGNVLLGDEYVASHLGAKPGAHVMLTITDHGCGMTDETLAHIFDPFFTTKQPGKGTGLGLSTVYGIVKQSDGYIWVTSELGKGTTFEIYLPSVESPLETVPSSSGRNASPEETTGAETLLLVEDEPSVRMLVTRVLAGQGYVVLSAGSAGEAIELVEAHSGGIDLVVSDVVLPGMGGRQLVETLQARLPDLKALYMSGYARDAIVHHGRLDPGIAFLEKPFTPEGLSTAVRSVLDCPAVDNDG